MMIPFADYLKEVTGYSPFYWQEAVVNDINHNRWYDCLGLPPATGKTSFIYFWYYALYRNILDKPEKRIIPIRFFYVVDRKIIVDGAYEAALNLKKKLNDPSSPLFEMGEIIKNYFGCDSPLEVAKIRGGMDRNEKNQWLTTPIQPTIISSTVDQYGSRLMFRGYGISSKVRSIHAAMTGIDSLIAVDEAHLAQALRQLIQIAIADFKLPGNVPPPRVIELTATGTNKNCWVVPPLQNDLNLQRRLQAIRQVTFVKTTSKVIAEALVKEAKTLAKKNNIVAVICNTVKNARKVYEILKGENAILLIGRIRGHDRDEIYKKYLSKNSLQSIVVGRNRKKDKPLFVIATQTIEVGANFDFDAMVTQAAPLDCLIQRFGRLDRLGELGTSNGVVVFKDEKDFVYGDTTATTFQWLMDNHPNGVNFSQIQPNPDYFAKSNSIARLPNILLNVLSHTHPSAPITMDGWLHGVKLKSDSDFSLVYRSEITEEMLRKSHKSKTNYAKNWIDLAHPVNQEILQLPIHCLHTKNDGADTEYTGPTEEKFVYNPLGKRLCLRFGDYKVIQMKEIRPGDLVFVPTTYGQYDEFGWNPDSEEEVEDVFDQHARRIVRLHPNWYPGFNINKYLSPQLNGQVDRKLFLDDFPEFIEKWLQNEDQKLVARAESLHRRKSDVARCFPKIPSAQPKYIITPDKKGVYCYLPDKARKAQAEQVLPDHNAKVGTNAKLFAERVGLNPDMIDLLQHSGLFHDIAKADPRFQEMLYYPNPPNMSILLAKSKGGYRQNAPQKYPKGWRHELQSVALIKENNLSARFFDPAVLEHIVGAHHGWMRNYIPIIPDDNFQAFTYNGYTTCIPYFDLYAGMDRNAFYELNAKYGFWGLAFLETILRLADWKN